MALSTSPISYIKRTRDYYLALGYDNPYQWACFEDVPFTPFDKPLDQAVIGLVTTAAPYQADKGDQGPGAPYNADAKFYNLYTRSSDEMPDLRISHVAIDRDHTSAEDIGSYFPLKVLQQLRNEGTIKDISPRFYGLPTNRSQRTTSEIDIPKLIDELEKDQLDAVVFVPNCPICHQSVSMAARAVEARQIPTVIMGAALDIVEHCGVPRLLFSDVPLGNAAGRPHDTASQIETMTLALHLLSEASAPRTTKTSPLVWSDDHSWKEDYSNAAKLSPQEIAQKRAAFDQGKAAAKAIRDQGSSETKA